MMTANSEVLRYPVKAESPDGVKAKMVDATGRVVIEGDATTIAHLVELVNKGECHRRALRHLVNEVRVQANDAQAYLSSTLRAACDVAEEIDNAEIKPQPLDALVASARKCESANGD